MTRLHRSYNRIWSVLLALAIWVEVIGILRPKKGDTLSEWVWAHLQPHWWGRMLFMPLLTWLVWHWGFSRPHTFGWPDLLAIAVGVALALLPPLLN